MVDVLKTQQWANHVYTPFHQVKILISIYLVHSTFICYDTDEKNGLLYYLLILSIFIALIKVFKIIVKVLFYGFYQISIGNKRTKRI